MKANRRSASISRRTFVKNTAMAATAFTIVPRFVLGGKGFIAPSDTLYVAAVGVGGKGVEDVNKTAMAPHARIAALCDVDERMASKPKVNFPEAKCYRDFRQMLDKEDKGIDAVIVTTPDHTHAVVALAAMERGKHVYVQKPLTWSIDE